MDMESLRQRQSRLTPFNVLGFWTLYRKEVRRFTKVALQTLFAPMVSTFLFFTVFTLAFGQNRGPVGGVEFSVFLIPGLVMMAILNNAFANTSSTLITSKVQGNTVDVLMAPLGSWELAGGFILGSVTRGVLVALLTLITLTPFAMMIPHIPWAVLYFSFSAAIMMAAAGLIAGIWAEKFEHLAAITNFVLLPLTFLSGTFYSISILPEPFKMISLFNPFFYMIDGFRYGFTGHAEGNVLIGVLFVLGLNILLLTICITLLNRGWKLRN